MCAIYLPNTVLGESRAWSSRLLLSCSSQCCPRYRMCKKSQFLTKTHGLIGSRQTYLPRDAANGRSHRSLNNGSEFYAEAKRIWENEQGRPSLCTVQALIAMYEYNKLQGKDRFGWIFLQTAVDMAIELGLFRRGDAGDISTDAQGYSRNFTAWSLYIYQA